MGARNSKCSGLPLSSAPNSVTSCPGFVLSAQLLDKAGNMPGSTQVISQFVLINPSSPLWLERNSHHRLVGMTKCTAPDAGEMRLVAVYPSPVVTAQARRTLCTYHAGPHRSCTLKQSEQPAALEGTASSCGRQALW